MYKLIVDGINPFQELEKYLIKLMEKNVTDEKELFEKGMRRAWQLFDREDSNLLKDDAGLRVEVARWVYSFGHRICAEQRRGGENNIDIPTARSRHMIVRMR